IRCDSKDRLRLTSSRAALLGACAVAALVASPAVATPINYSAGLGATHDANRDRINQAIDSALANRTHSPVAGAAAGAGQVPGRTFGRPLPQVGASTDAVIKVDRGT